MKFNHLFSIFVFSALHLSIAQGAENISNFSKDLEDIRGECSQMASKLYGDASVADTKNRADRELRRLKTRQEVQLYGMGRGRSETTYYQIDRMKEDNKADADADKQLSMQRNEGSAMVSDCVEKAIEKGKNLYSAAKRGKNFQESASNLMTAWLVNTKSISFYSPNGSPESDNDWKKAKAAAELSGL